MGQIKTFTLEIRLHVVTMKQKAQARCDIVQEAGSKTIPKKKTCKKAKWLSEEVLRREVKGKGERE